MDEQLSKLHDLLKDFSTAMFVTHDGVENFHARPMAIAEIEKSCVIWFITNARSGKVHEIEHDTRVAVICQKDFAAYWDNEIENL